MGKHKEEEERGELSKKGSLESAMGQGAASIMLVVLLVLVGDVKRLMTVRRDDMWIGMEWLILMLMLLIWMLVLMLMLLLLLLLLQLLFQHHPSPHSFHLHLHICLPPLP